ncbi:MAG: hypothetical protein JO356_08685 [Acidobacteria bacterium]|nr:hypothetical protein [Acidobacteriota bacterium]
MAHNNLQNFPPLFDLGFRQLLFGCLDREIVRVNRIMDELTTARDANRVAQDKAVSRG